MKNTNIELIEKARNYLEESRHEACFVVLDKFFEKIKVQRENPVYQLHNQLRVVKTRYHNLIRQKRQGIISNEDYNVNFNNISFALYAFFDSIIDETERLATPKTVKEGTLQNNTINIILVLNGNFNDFSEDNAIEITNKIRRILRIKEEEFKYLNIEQGSILIHIAANRDYELLIKLKSLVELNIVYNLVSVKCGGVVTDKFCAAMNNLELNLEETELGGINLREANLREANLRGADLRGADLVGTDLVGADLVGADLRAAHLKAADLGWADLKAANLVAADLVGAELRGVDLRGADLVGADLVGADLRGADLRGSHLGGADLKAADLRAADLRAADLRGANLGEANLKSTNLKDANLKDANLNGVKLGKTSLAEMNLLKVNSSLVAISEYLFYTKFNETIFNINQKAELIKMGADTSRCIFLDDFGKDLGASIYS